MGRCISSPLQEECDNFYLKNLYGPPSKEIYVCNKGSLAIINFFFPKILLLEKFLVIMIDPFKFNTNIIPDSLYHLEILRNIKLIFSDYDVFNGIRFLTLHEFNKPKNIWLLILICTQYLIYLTAMSSNS